jgi:hypothetical protein
MNLFLPIMNCYLYSWNINQFLKCYFQVSICIKKFKYWSNVFLCNIMFRFHLPKIFNKLGHSCIPVFVLVISCLPKLL